MIISSNRPIQKKFTEKFCEKDDVIGCFDKHGAIWTAELYYKEWDKAFVSKLADYLNLLIYAPKIEKRKHCECKINSFINKGGKVISIISNDEYFSCVPKIRVHKKIKAVKSLTKYNGYKISISEDSFSVVVPARTMEILEIELI